MSAGLPPIDQSLLPADVRSAAPAQRDAYTAALGFEQLLVQQLTSTLADSAKSAFGGEDSPYASLLPNAMSDGIMGAGGLGLARQLAGAIDPQSATPTGAGGAPPLTTTHTGSSA